MMPFVVNLKASLIQIGVKPFPLYSQLSNIPRFLYDDDDDVLIQTPWDPFY